MHDIQIESPFLIDLISLTIYDQAYVWSWGILWVCKPQVYI